MIPDTTSLADVLPEKLVHVLAQSPHPVRTVGELRRAPHREIVSAIARTHLLTAKELAAALRRHLNYVDAMKRAGFLMPGGTATVDEARAWLARNPPPRARSQLMRTSSRRILQT